MKGLKIKIQALLLCGVLITGLFSSCASDENIDNGNKVNAGDKVLTLTLNTPKATTTSGAKTRVTNMTANTTEDQINRLTIGIFDAAGTTVRTIQELSSNDTPGTTGSFTTDDDTKKTTATLVTNSLADKDKVLVAVNAPAGTFKGCKTVSDFEARTIAIDAALATPKSGTVGAAEATDNIPMYGIGSIAASGTTFTASVNVQHQLAKITVGTVKVNFAQNGPYANATFQPTSFFLINVPSDLAFSTAAFPSVNPTSFFHGWAASTSTSDLKAYLGTGIFSTAYSALKYSNVVEENSISPNSILYTMPNNVTDHNTKLVIGGEFDSDGSGTSVPTTVYYPVNINWVYDTDSKTSGPADGGKGGPTAKAVYPNKNYICNITIKTKGADSPNTTIDPEDVSVTVTVTGFSEASQNTTFE